MEREEIFSLVKNCLNGEPASCIAACPFHLDIRSFLKKTAKGRLGAALQELNKSLPFPKVISEICFAPCEKQCQRYTVLGEETISVRLLEQACLQKKEKKERRNYTLPPLNKRAAVVGAGPGGLACALYMNRKRYPVTVFDKKNNWGGSLESHEKFPVFEEEFLKKFESAEVEFCFGKTIYDLKELQEYDVICIATGKGGPDFGLLESCDRKFGTTSVPNVFLGGELLGLSCVEGMAHASIVSKAMESFLQTGNPLHAAMQWEKMDCTKTVSHDGAVRMPHITPAGEFYTEKEAQAEAGRCLQCDCEACVNDCSLLKKYKKKPPRIAIDVAQDGMTRNSVSSACITRQTWSCNLCGHCADVCKEHVSVGQMFELSRLDRVKSGNYPPAFHGYWLSEMQQTVTETGFVRPAPGESGCSYVFFPGCRLGAANPDYVTKSYDALLQKNQKTGIMLDCCGIPALWAGEGETFQTHLNHIREQWEALGEPAIVYACASCRRTFERFLPEIPLISLYEILDAERKNGADREFAVFDPCSAAPMQELKTAVRSLAKRSGCQLSDYDSRGKCCGFGGHIQLANPEFYDETAAERARETELPYLVYCANCRDVFRTHGKEASHILDVIFELNERPAATLEEKRKNNLTAKKTILKKYWKEEFLPEKKAWEALILHIPEEIYTDMERLLIPEREVQKTIWLNEEAGEGFENGNGEIVCRMVSSYITCWVKYKKESDAYYIREVYSHRMHIREDEI